MTNLIEKIEKDETDFGKPDKIIETLVSKIFFFGEKVVKIYKWKKEFFGDLSDPEFRRNFVFEDFFWNNAMSPEIYLELLPLKDEGRKWIKVDAEDADDFCIIMSKLQNNKTLTDLAESGKLNPDVLKEIAKAVVFKQREIMKAREEELAPMLEKDLKELEREVLEDLRQWSYMATNHISKEKTDYIVGKLLSILNNPEYISWIVQTKKSALIDANGDNIIVGQDGKFQFIDILPPKFNWRVEDETANIGRIAADVSVFMGEDAAEILYQTFSKITDLEVPPVVKILYETRNAMIQAPYRFILNQPDRAKKYLDFVENKIASI